MSNKPRYYLTSIGVIIGIVLYLVGSLVLQSYNHSKINVYSEFDSDVIYAKNLAEEEFEIIAQNVDCSFSVYKDSLYRVNAKEVNKNINLDLKVVGVSDNFCYMPIPSVLEIDNLVKVQLLSGRCITRQDLLAESNVAVLNNSIAQMLFSESALGKKLNISGTEYTIVGILSDSLDLKTQGQNLSTAIKKNENYTVVGNVYIPYTACKNATGFSKVVFSNVENVEYACQFIDSVSANDIKCLSYDRVVLQKQKEMGDFSNMLDIALYIILAFSAVLIAIIMIFSMKERIGEIGIKKAMGATSSDIAFQFVFESLFMATLTSFIGALIGVGVGLILCVALNISSIYFSVEMILIPVLLNFFVCLITSIIPCVISNKRNIVEALRFE